MAVVGGQQQQADGLERVAGDDHGAGVEGAHLAERVQVLHPVGPAVTIGEHLQHPAVGPQVGVAARQGLRHGGEPRVPPVVMNAGRTELLYGNRFSATLPGRDHARRNVVRPERAGTLLRLVDVAAACGVTKSVASRVLNNDPTLNVRLETRQRILAAARSWATGHTRAPSPAPGHALSRCSSRT